MTLELSRQVPASGSVWRLFFSKPCCSCRRYHGFAANLASTFAFLIILTLAACFMDFVAASGRRFLRADRKPSAAPASPTQGLADPLPEDPILQGTYETLAGLEAVWQLPPPGVVTQGVVLLTHGCGTAATHSWPRSASCTPCTGLPGSSAVSLTRHALLRGVAVVAMNSTRNDVEAGPASGAAGCRQHFSPVLDPEGVVAADNERLRMALGQLLSDKGLSGLPLFTLGLGQGAGWAMALELGANPRPGVPMSGVMLVDPGRLLHDLTEHLDRSTSNGALAATPFPPLLVLHTTPYGEEGEQDLAAMRQLHNLGVDTTEIALRARPLGSQHSQANAGTPQLSPEALLGPAEVGMVLAWMEGQGGSRVATAPQQPQQQRQKEREEQQKQADTESGLGSQQQATDGGGGGSGQGGAPVCNCKCLDWAEACNLYLDSVINYNDYLQDLDFDLDVQLWEAKQQWLGSREWGQDKEWGRTQAEEGDVDTDLLEIGVDGHLYLLDEEDAYAADAARAAAAAAATAAAAAGGHVGSNGPIRQQQQQQQQLGTDRSSLIADRQQLRLHALRTSFALHTNYEYYYYYDEDGDDGTLLPDPSFGLTGAAAATLLDNNHFHELLVKLAMTAGTVEQGHQGQLGSTVGGESGDMAGAVEQGQQQGVRGGPGAHAGAESVGMRASNDDVSKHVPGADLRDSRLLDLYYLSDLEYYSVPMEEDLTAAGAGDTAADVHDGELVGAGRTEDAEEEAVSRGSGGGLATSGGFVRKGAAAGTGAGVQEGEQDGSWFWSAEGEYWQDYAAMHDEGREDVTPEGVAEHLRSTRGGGRAAAAAAGYGHAALAGPRDVGAAGAGVGVGVADGDGTGDGAGGGVGRDAQAAGDADGVLQREAGGSYHDYYEMHDQGAWDVPLGTSPDARSGTDAGTGGTGVVWHGLQSAGAAVGKQAES